MPELTAAHRRNIATIAAQIAEIFAAHGWKWTDPRVKSSSLYTPGAADIALDLNTKISGLKPGHSIESGRIVVKWPVDEDEGPMDVRVFVHFGDLKVAEPATPREDPHA